MNFANIGHSDHLGGVLTGESVRPLMKSSKVRTLNIVNSTVLFQNSFKIQKLTKIENPIIILPSITIIITNRQKGNNSDSTLSLRFIL